MSDETWAQVRKHYDDDQIAALVSLVALINAANRLAVIVHQQGGFLRARHVRQLVELIGRRIPARPRIIRSGPDLSPSGRGYGYRPGSAPLDLRPVRRRPRRRQCHAVRLTGPAVMSNTGNSGGRDALDRTAP